MTQTKMVSQLRVNGAGASSMDSNRTLMKGGGIARPATAIGNEIDITRIQT